MDTYQKANLIGGCQADCNALLSRLVRDHGVRSKSTTESGGHNDPRLETIFMGKEDDADRGVILTMRLSRSWWSIEIKGFTTSSGGHRTFNKPQTFNGRANEGLPASARTHIEQCMLWAIEQTIKAPLGAEA